MINKKQLFCILLVLVMVAIPASGKDWQWIDQSELGSISLGKEMLNASINSNSDVDWVTLQAIFALALFYFADILETKRHNAIEEEWQRQVNKTLVKISNSNGVKMAM